jgi:hypothetical protein
VLFLELSLRDVVVRFDDLRIDGLQVLEDVGGRREPRAFAFGRLLFEVLLLQF